MISSPLVLLTVQAGFKAKLDWFNEIIESSTPLWNPPVKRKRWDVFCYFFPSEHCRQAGARAVLCYFSSPSPALCHTVALSCSRRVFITKSQLDSHNAPRLPAEISASHQKHAVKAGGFTKALSTQIHNSANKHQTDKCYWETGGFLVAFTSGWSRQHLSFKQMSQKQQNKTVKHILLSRLLPLFCYSIEVPKIETPEYIWWCWE